MWRKENIMHCWWEWKSVPPLCKTVQRFLKKQKIKNRTAIQPRSSSTTWHFPEENENTNSKRYLYHHVHCNMIYNSQDVETTCPSTDKWIRKTWRVYTCTHATEYYIAIKRISLCHLRQHRWTYRVLCKEKYVSLRKKYCRIPLISRILR